MKRLLLPSLCAVLLTGCDAVDAPLVAVAADKAASTTNAAIEAAAVTDTNAVDTNVGLALAPDTVKPPTPPPNLPAPVQEVVRLAQTTLGESVLVDYVATIKEPFKLDAEQIIYLHDLGVPEAAIQALLKQEQTFPAKAVAAPVAAAPAYAPPVQPAPQVVETPPAQTAGPAPAAGVTQVTVVQPVTEVSYTTFYDTLSPYGVWVEVPGYGRCWQPTVAVINPGWRPYCDDGYWVWSDCGWYWRSHYSWGWAPFHYGRWQLASGRGWCWVPDNRWGPAWVTWRSSADHCGWAPLPPHSGWSVGIGLTWGGHRAGPDCDFGLGYNSFVYLGWNRFCDPRPWRYCAPRSEVVTIYHGSRPVNDFRGGGHTGGGGNGPGSVNIVGNNNTVIINNGPGLKPVQEHARAEIPKFHIVDSPDASHTVPGRVTTRPAGGAAAVMPVYRPNLASVAPRVQPGPAAPVPHRQEPGVVSGFRSGGSAMPIASTTPTRSEPTIIRPGGANANPVPSARNNPVGSPYSTPAPSRPSASSGFTASPVTPTAPVTRTEAPKPAPTVIPGNRYPAANVQPTPTAPNSTPVTRPAPIYSAPVTRPAPAYDAPVSRPAPAYSAPVTRPAPSYSAPPTPSYRPEPARSYTPPAPSYTAPSRPAYTAPSPSTPARGGGGNDGAARPVPGRHQN